jgi:type II secretory pathway pseudopilin PulG
MESIVKQSKRKAAFTIVELLTVMSIIVILIGLLVPALNHVRRYAKNVRQMAQFHSIEAALELFNNEFEGYPQSNALDGDSNPYCGAMKLCEAMMGWDLLGFHTDSRFLSDPGTLYDPTDLKSRRGPFLPLESVEAHRVGNIYQNAATVFDERNFVLCDVFNREMLTGEKTGMPILYYKANTANELHLLAPDLSVHLPPDPTLDAGNIYSYWDNHALVGLGKPWETSTAIHKLYSDTTAATPENAGVRFYVNTRNEKITTAWRPYRSDSYILISAGFDGEYGTADDVCNFQWKYRETIPPGL